ncbi:MAG TPA: hypothetical protein VGF94_13275 [Kofleriaceae bacterium]
MKKLWIVALVAGLAATADAQPSDPYGQNGAPPPAQAPPQPTSPPAPPPPPPPPQQPPAVGGEPEAAEPPPKPVKPRKPDPHVDLPNLISSPTGWLLPAAVVYSRTGLDTGGGFVSDNRVGLGDVAEFGLETLDQIRSRAGDTATSTNRIQPYFAASFRMGLGEDRLFDGQPGLVLGFQKSFERDDGDFQTRLAQLTLVASKKLGDRASIHFGGAFWDAEFEDTSGTTVTLHGNGTVGNQIRPFGGLAASPIDKSEILVDLSWAPEFCYLCASASDQIKLRPELAWGVRYQVAPWMLLESGVRVPDIGNANLLDAQIYGAVTFVTWGLRHAVDSVK